MGGRGMGSSSHIEFPPKWQKFYENDEYIFYLEHKSIWVEDNGKRDIKIVPKNQEQIWN